VPKGKPKTEELNSSNSDRIAILYERRQPGLPDARLRTDSSKAENRKEETGKKNLKIWKFENLRMRKFGTFKGFQRGNELTGNHLQFNN
jgi:hypothetical protein